MLASMRGQIEVVKVLLAAGASKEPTTCPEPISEKMIEAGVPQVVKQNALDYAIAYGHDGREGHPDIVALLTADTAVGGE